MNKSAQQIHNDFHGQLVAITNKNGEKLVGIIMSVAGMEKASTLVPQTSFIVVDIISDIEVYKKEGISYAFEHKIIHPDDIEDVRPYDLVVNLQGTP